MTVRIKIQSGSYHDLLDLSVDADESFAHAAVAEVTKLLAKTMGAQEVGAQEVGDE